nr:hypothetical protein [Tanacetum cinerariifolium]
MKCLGIAKLEVVGGGIRSQMGQVGGAGGGAGVQHNDQNLGFLVIFQALICTLHFFGRLLYPMEFCGIAKLDVGGG